MIFSLGMPLCFAVLRCMESVLQGTQANAARGLMEREHRPFFLIRCRNFTTTDAIWLVCVSKTADIHGPSPAGREEKAEPRMPAPLYPPLIPVAI